MFFISSWGLSSYEEFGWNVMAIWPWYTSVQACRCGLIIRIWNRTGLASLVPQTMIVVGHRNNLVKMWHLQLHPGAVWESCASDEQMEVQVSTLETQEITCLASFWSIAASWLPSHFAVIQPGYNRSWRGWIPLCVSATQQTSSSIWKFLFTSDGGMEQYKLLKRGGQAQL